MFIYFLDRLNLADQSSANKSKKNQTNLTRAGPIIINNITQKATTTTAKTTTTTTTTLSPKSQDLNSHEIKVDDFVSLEPENDKKHIHIKNHNDDDEEELTLVAITPRKNHVIPTSLPEKLSKNNNKTSVSLPNTSSSHSNSTSPPSSTSLPYYDTYYYDYEPLDENSEFDDDSETIIITQKRNQPESKDQPIVAPSRLVPHSFQLDRNLAGQGSEHVSVEEVAEINRLSTTTIGSVPNRGRFIPKESEKELTEEQKRKIKSHIVSENEPQTFQSSSVSYNARPLIGKMPVEVLNHHEDLEDEVEEVQPEDYVNIPARKPSIFSRTSKTSTSTTTSTTESTTTTTTSTTPRPTTTSSTTTTVQPTTQKIILRNRLQLTSDNNQYKQLDSKSISSFKDSDIDQSIRSYSSHSSSSDKINRHSKDGVKARSGELTNSEVLEARKSEKVRRILNRLPEKLRFVEPTTYAYAPASKLKLIETHKSGPVTFVEQTTTPITKTSTTTTTEQSTTESSSHSNLNDKELGESKSEVPEVHPPTVSNNSNQSLVNLNRLVESIQSFTSRGIVFKEALNRSITPSYYTKSVVSPFDSLAAQKRGEKDKLRSSTVKTSVNVTPLKPIIKGDLVASRDGFIITSLGREVPKTLSPISTTSTTTEEMLPVTEVAWSETSTHGSTESSVSGTASSVIDDQRHTKLESINRGRYRPFLNYDIVESTTALPSTIRARNQVRKFTPPLIVSTDLPNAVRKKLIRVRPTPGFKQKSTIGSTTEAVELDSSVESEIDDIEEAYERFVSNSTVQSSTEPQPIEKEIPGIRQRLIFKSSEDEPSIVSTSPKQEALIMPIGMIRKGSEAYRTVQITERPRYFAGSKYETTQVVDTDRTTKRFKATVEMPEMRVPEQITEKSIELSSEAPQDEDDSSPENDRHIAHFVDPDQELVSGDESGEELDDYAFIETTPSDVLKAYDENTHRVKTTKTTTTTERPSTIRHAEQTEAEKTKEILTTTTHRQTTTMDLSPSTTHPRSMLPPRASRVNNAIKTTIAAAGIPRRLKPASSYSKCNENSPFAKCNEIPSRYYFYIKLNLKIR